MTAQQYFTTTWLVMVVLLAFSQSTLSSPMESGSVRSKGCNDCHEQAGEQWHRSLHSKALSSGVRGQFELFDEETIADCRTCHSPTANEVTRFSPSATHWDIAVGCTACHGSLAQPHPSPKGMPISRKSIDHTVCIDCHQFGEEGIIVNGKPLENTYEEWSRSIYGKQGVSCITCHMPAGNHDIRGIHNPDMVRSGLEVSAKRKGKRLEIRLYNKGAGHALPTYITPRIRVHWKDPNGGITPITILQRKMNWDESSGWSEVADSRLMPLENRSFIIESGDSESGQVEVWVDPDADYYERVYPAILEAMRESDVSEKSQQLIRQAMTAAGQSSYLLYSLDCRLDDVHCH